MSSENKVQHLKEAGRIGGLVKSEKKTKAVRQNGRIGGLVKSEKKTKAVRQNGSKGGRPLLPIETLSDAQKLRRERYETEKLKDEFSDL